MLRRLTLGFAGLALVAVVAACNSSNTSNLNGGLGIGPDFPTSTLYAANSNTNGISIYSAPLADGDTPKYQIGGSSTLLDGPQYMTFDTGETSTALNNSLWVTNYDAGSGASQVLVFKYLATGAVIPLQNFTYAGMGQPRGIAVSATTHFVAVGAVFPSAILPELPSQIQFYTPADSGAVVPFAVITGPATGLNVPSGLLYDGDGNVVVANRQGASVETFAVPTPVPTPSTSPSPSPSPTASAGPTATPTAIPTPQVDYNEAPLANVSGASTGLANPAGVALDASGNLYVADAGNASIREFAKGATGNVAPIRVISGAATLLQVPLDVRVDANGLIYVSDSGAQKVFVFAAGATGNVAPTITLPAQAGIVGIGLSP